MHIRHYLPSASTPKMILIKSPEKTDLTHDKEQSPRLHNPIFRKTKIDPMTGENLNRFNNNICLVTADMTICFASEKTRDDYMNLPFNHPNRCLPYAAMNDDVTDPVH